MIINKEPTIADILAGMEKERKAAGEQAKESRMDLIKRFMKADITKVRINFAGSGDSGCIEEIIINYTDGSEVSKNPYWKSGDKETIEADIEAWSDRYLESCHVDWYNNDGGQGHIEFDMTKVPFKFECSIDVNETVSNNAYYVEEIA